MKKTIIISLALLLGLSLSLSVQASNSKNKSIPKSSAIACTMEYDPVCGADGITYGNRCMARKVKIKYNGECRDALSLNKACTREYMPVCGVNGQTYPNKCLAGDVKIEYKAACKERISHPKEIKKYKNIIRVGNTLYGDRTDESIINERNIIKMEAGDYSVTKVTTSTCQQNSDCITPMPYVAMSSCPYSSLCLEGKCTVVCPDYNKKAWQEIINAINNCDVKEIMQVHSRMVTVTLKDGRKLTAFEPTIDDVMNVASQAKEKCGQIIMATE